MAYLELSDNLLSHILFGINSNDLAKSAGQAADRKSPKCTFRAITTLVEACMTLLTVPPFPAPSSFRIMRSSLRRSSLNSRPISSVSVRLLSRFPRAPGICASPSDGLEALGAGLLRVSPLAFFLLKELGVKESDIVSIERSCRKELKSLSR